MPATIPATIWLLVDEEGRYDCWGYDFGDDCRDDGCASLSHSLEQWRENHEQQFGLATQLYKLNLTVPKPARVEISIDLGSQQAISPAEMPPEETQSPAPQTEQSDAVPRSTPGATAAKEAAEQLLKERGRAKSREIGEAAGLSGQAVGATLGRDPRFVRRDGFWMLSESETLHSANGRAATSARPRDPGPGVFAPPKDRERFGGASASADEEQALLAFLDEQGGGASLAMCTDRLKLSERQFMERFGSRLAIKIRPVGRGWRVEKNVAT